MCNVWIHLTIHFYFYFFLIFAHSVQGFWTIYHFSISSEVFGLWEKTAMGTISKIRQDYPYQGFQEVY